MLPHNQWRKLGNAPMDFWSKTWSRFAESRDPRCSGTVWKGVEAWDPLKWPWWDPQELDGTIVAFIMVYQWCQKWDMFQYHFGLSRKIEPDTCLDVETWWQAGTYHVWFITEWLLALQSSKPRIHQIRPFKATVDICRPYKPIGPILGSNFRSTASWIINFKTHSRVPNNWPQWDHDPRDRRRGDMESSTYIASWSLASGLDMAIYRKTMERL